MDTDLDALSPEQLIDEVRRLRNGIRKHRDSSGQDLCWHHPDLWALLPERTDPVPVVPEWPQFMAGCVRYRQSLEKQAPDAPRTTSEGLSTISRQWRGLARPERAAEYERHLRNETFPQLARFRGFIDASILRRPVDGGIEFLVVSRWESLEAIAQFAGSDVEAAVVPLEVQSMMIEYDRRVRHYESRMEPPK